jgi:cyclase
MNKNETTLDILYNQKLKYFNHKLYVVLPKLMSKIEELEIEKKEKIERNDKNILDIDSKIESYKKKISTVYEEKNKYYLENSKYLFDYFETKQNIDKNNTPKKTINSFFNVKEEKEPNYEIIEKINKRCNTPFSFGGGIKNEKDALQCIKKGADKILINTNLSKELVAKISNEIGRASIIGGADIYYDGKKYNLFKNNTKTNIDALEYIKNIMNYEIGELKITYVDREGTRKGFDIEFSNKIQDLCNKPIIFEGGFSDLDDIGKAFKNGINSIAIGSLITFSDNNIFMIKQYLENKGFEVRLRK